MKFASRAADGANGRLLLVSRDLRHAVEAKEALTLQAALDEWDRVEPLLREQWEALNRQEWSDAPLLDPTTLAAALPRSYQFLDASAFLAHNHILAEAWGYSRRSQADPPLMYQGLSDHFYPARGEVPFRAEEDLIDFEAEFGVILSRTPLGTRPEDAIGHVKLVVVINDWSLRAFGPGEMKGGFGFLHAKPPSSMSAIAVTPDELGAAWHSGRVGLPMEIYRGDRLFGRPHGQAMSYGFGELIAHACTTRTLCAGTVLGSGTVSNMEAEVVGSGCIAERRALDQLDSGRAPTPYLSFGESIRLEVFDADGQTIFGPLQQKVAAF